MGLKVPEGGAMGLKVPVGGAMGLNALEGGAMELNVATLLLRKVGEAALFTVGAPA